MTPAAPIGAREVAARFALGADVVSVASHGAGHINETYEVGVRGDEGRNRRFIVQQLNRTIFHDPEAVIRNAERVLAHLEEVVREEGGDPRREVPTLVLSDDGRSFVRDRNGEIWRCFARIEGVSAHATIGDPKRARTVAAAFGRFLRRMSGFPADRLEVTIPGFHDANAVLLAYRDAVRLDPLGRAAATAVEHRFIEHHVDLTAQWVEWLTFARAPLRPIHNDTKTNNVLIDDESGRGLCVIDLDTVMAGFALIDIGDCARSVLTGPEEAGRPIDLGLFEAVVRGFVDEAGGLLSGEEYERIVFATRAIALELGTRFLTDYLAGDRWFPASRPEENLERCRVQLDLVRGLEGQAAELEEIVRRARR